MIYIQSKTGGRLSHRAELSITKRKERERVNNKHNE